MPLRSSDRERTSVVKSGCIFIYAENISGIKHWTDGLTRSLSRILSDFFFHREIDHSLAPEAKGRKPQNQSRVRKAGRNKDTRKGIHYRLSRLTLLDTRDPNELQRSMVGPVIDSYLFEIGAWSRRGPAFSSLERCSIWSLTTPQRTSQTKGYKRHATFTGLKVLIPSRGWICGAQYCLVDCITTSN